MIYQVGEGSGVYCIEGAGPRCYFIARPEPMLVDTGAPGHYETVIRALAQIGVQPIHIKKIVLTHHHFGHVGGLYVLKRRSGALVYAHSSDISYISGRIRRRAVRSPMERAFQSAVSFARFADVTPVAVDRRLEDDMEINGWRVVHTPGHTPGHICLLRGDMLISGDLLQYSGGVFREMPPSTIADLPTSRNSIIRVAEFDIEAILPGHNAPYIMAARRKVRELALRLWEERRRATRPAQKPDEK
jgi:glyoxylase-like metal-dependent hydrolase (beta-lactamase superfamily II)